MAEPALTQDSGQPSRQLHALALDESPEAQVLIAIDLLKANKIANAMPYLEEASRQGYGYADLLLGQVYMEGSKEFKIDLKLAEYYLLKAYNEDVIEAANTLGRLYGNKSKYPDFYSEKNSLKYTTVAAEYGEPDSQTLLGIIYRDGKFGKEIDYAAAYYWFKKAAKQGNATAQLMLGMLYYYGHGTAKDISKAFALIMISAATGNESALKSAAVLKVLMSAEDIDSARAIATQCVKSNFNKCDI